MKFYFPHRSVMFVAVSFATLISVAAAGCASETADDEDTDSQASAYSRNQVSCDSTGLGRRLHVNISRLSKAGTQSYEAYWLDDNPAGGFRFERISDFPVKQMGNRFSSMNGFTLGLAGSGLGVVGEAVVPSGAGPLRARMVCKSVQ